MAGAVEVTLSPDLIGLAVQYPDGRYLRLALLPTTGPVPKAGTPPPRREPVETETEGESDRRRRTCRTPADTEGRC